MKDTAIFGLTYPESTDKPDGAAQIEAALKDVETLLSTIEQLLGTVAVPAAPAPGNLVIVNGTSDPVYKAATGDVTNNSAGVFSIGAEKVATAAIQNLAVTAAKIAGEAVEAAKIKGEAVTEAKIAALAVAAGKLAAEAVETGKIKALAVTEAKIAALAVTEGKIADGAVTSRKAKITAGVKRATGGLAITAGLAYTDIPGAEVKVTAGVASKFVMAVYIDMSATAIAGGRGVAVSVKVDALEEDLVLWRMDEVGRKTLTVFYEYALAAGEHTIKLRGKAGNAASTGSISEACHFKYEMFAS